MDKQDKDILNRAFQDYRNARQHLLSLKPELKLMYTRLERNEKLAPGSYTESCQDLFTSIDAKTDINDISNKLTDITDAWNCDLISDEQCDSLINGVADYQETRDTYHSISTSL